MAPANQPIKQAQEDIRAVKQAVFGYGLDSGLVGDMKDIKEDVKELRNDVKRILFAFITGTLSIMAVLIAALLALR